MAHIFPKRPENPNANDNNSGIPEFIPIPAEPVPSSTAESAPATDMTSVPTETSTPTTDVVTEEFLSNAPATEKAPRSKRGRPPKNANPKTEKAPKKRAVEKEVTTIHFAPATLQRLRIMHVLNKVSISDIVSECCDDMLNRSYQCHNPSCNCKFTLSCIEEDTAPKPVCCPVCGSDSLRQIKSGF